jgi:transposase
VPPRKLTDDELKVLLGVLEREARKLGRTPTVWTAKGVAERIKMDYGIAYHPGNLWRRMSHLGWSFQRSPVVQEKRFKAPLKRKVK